MLKLCLGNDCSGYDQGQNSCSPIGGHREARGDTREESEERRVGRVSGAQREHAVAASRSAGRHEALRKGDEQQDGHRQAQISRVIPVGEISLRWQPAHLPGGLSEIRHFVAASGTNHRGMAPLEGRACLCLESGTKAPAAEVIGRLANAQRKGPSCSPRLTLASSE